jgi:two-component system phosphate regulon sensor histidine kinase PhoR
MIQDLALEPAITNTALRLMSSAEQNESYRRVFQARCFVPDQLAVIEEQMAKKPDRPRTDIVQLEHPRQFIRRYSAPLYNDEHVQTGFLVSFQDITHEVEQDRLRQDFISNASHELRTPVTSVKLLLENLVGGAKDDPAVADDFLNDALDEIDRMHELVNDLLDMAALEGGRQNLTFTTFDVAKVCAEATTTIVPQAKQRDVALITDLPPGELLLEADRNRLRQVLVNLIANAVKFTPAGGSVTLKGWVEAGAMRFTIADTGIGIPAQDLPHIFDRFFRVTRARSRMQGGSGLGLTIVKNAIDAHRGEINVESTENVGTTVFIKLPLAQAEADA